MCDGHMTGRQCWQVWPECNCGVIGSADLSSGVTTCTRCLQKLLCLLQLTPCINKTRRRTPPPPQSPTSPRQDPFPLIPTSCPSVLTYVSLHLLIYDLISTQHTFKVCERPFVHTLWSHCPPKPSRFTLLSLGSIFNLCSHLRRCSEEEETWDSPLTNLHKSSAHFTSRWFGSYSAQLHSVLARRGSFTLAAQEEILSWRLPHSRSSAVTYAVVNPIATELCQTRTLLINGVWEGGLHFCFFLHNYCLFRIGGKLNLSHCQTRIRQAKESLYGQVQLSGWHFYLRSSE